jgi:5-methylcytosine-specific restriction endonuclease McrA
VQAYYDEGHTFRQCQQHFGFSGAAWGKAVERGEITPRPRSKSIEQVLASKSARDCKKLKLLRDGIFKYCCSQCGIFEWLGRPLALQIDHINGIHNDWRVENLRMLCPNCHSQTPTFAGRNAKRRPQSLQDSGSAV